MEAKSNLKATRREKTGKGAARQLRRQGFIPAVVYGGEGSMNLTLNPNELTDLLKELGSDNAIMPLMVEGESGAEKNVLLKEMQTNTLTDELLHVDLLEISLDKAITVEVPITLVGDPELVKDGEAVIEQLINSVEVQCLPTLIPAAIEVEVSGLGMNDVVQVGDLVLPEGVDVLRDPTSPVATVGAVKVVIEEEVPEEAEEEAEEGEEGEEGAETEEAEAGERD